MAIINCSECGKEISDKAESCPHCGNPSEQEQTAAPQESGVMACPSCNLKLIPMEKPASFSISSLIAIMVGLFGLGLLLTNLIAGLLTILIAILMDQFGRSKRVVMTCPQCRYEATDHSSFAYQLGRIIGGSMK